MQPSSSGALTHDATYLIHGDVRVAQLGTLGRLRSRTVGCGLLVSKKGSPSDYNPSVKGRCYLGQQDSSQGTRIHERLTISVLELIDVDPVEVSAGARRPPLLHSPVLQGQPLVESGQFGQSTGGSGGVGGRRPHHRQIPGAHGGRRRSPTAHYWPPMSTPPHARMSYTGPRETPDPPHTAILHRLALPSLKHLCSVPAVSLTLHI